MSTLAIPSINSIDQYIQYVRQIPCLTHEEEVSLAKDYQDNGNHEAAMKIILAHLKAVLPFVRKYSGYGLPQEDLIQEGNVGLMKAAKKYDYKQGVRFISFAIHWIKAEISEFVIKNWRIVKQFTTKSSRKLFFNYRSLKTNGLDNLTSSEAEDISRELNVPVKDVIDAGKSFSLSEMSLDQVNDQEHVYSVPDNHWEPTNVLERAYEDQKLEKVREAMSKLSDREYKIIESRWLADDKKSLHELGSELNISYERVRQLEVAAIKKLKVYMSSLES